MAVPTPSLRNMKSKLFTIRSFYILVLAISVVSVVVFISSYRGDSSANNINQEEGLLHGHGDKQPHENVLTHSGGSKSSFALPSDLKKGFPSSEQSEQKVVEEQKKPEIKELTIWSTSFHISPIFCLRHFMKNVFEKRTGIKVNIIEKSLSGHCHLTGHCARDLRVLNHDTAKGEYGCTVPTAKALYETYKSDPVFKNVDLVMCDHNIAMCELYMPFDVPMVLYSTTRYELWRHDPNRWRNLNENIKLIASKKQHTVVANNLYDAKYLNYFTGMYVPVLDSFCGYSADEGTYNPTRSEILIGPSRLSVNLNTLVLNDFYGYAKKDQSSLKLSTIRELYPHYKYSDLAHHPAIVVIPYQLSVMSFFEYYRLAIPIYYPSVDLLTQWHMQHRILSEKTWHMVLQRRPGRGSPVEHHPKSNIPKEMDPNNEENADSVKYWNEFSDLYQWPHVIYFSSIEDLYQKLSKATPDYYKEVSKKMQEYNQQLQDHLVKQWTGIVERVADHKQQGRKTFSSFEEAMKTLWNKESKCDI
ncbi:hypothetical protein C9374_006331 [Naegleria lovaniensis]|uniref:Uncharacterized protein n=1 Tax=Naegleria lovaniensis TaxID=51637 RepID=A0AA88GMX0_NAELO|nr:uncharacterized protein C9374_006331 [Naegleria lovaniensis]KAG2381342.1 hypothetical protein C9374_006331 [Naegleria lovaniensis]